MVETNVIGVNSNYCNTVTTVGESLGTICKSPYVITGTYDCCKITNPKTEFNIKNGIKVIVENQIARVEFPKVTDVNIIVPDKVVEVTFSDGTKEKSVCREPDVFSLETSISICISKKIMGGSGAYNNTVKHGMKVYDDKLKKEAADKAEKERIAKKREKRLEYKARRAIRRRENEIRKADAEKERQIEIQKEAYLRAMDVLRAEGRGV